MSSICVKSVLSCPLYSKLCPLFCPYSEVAGMPVEKNEMLCQEHYVSITAKKGRRT